VRRMFPLIAAVASVLVVALALVLRRRGADGNAHLPHDTGEYARRLAAGDRHAFGPDIRTQVRPSGFRPDRTGDTLSQIISTVARVHGVDAATLSSSTRLADPPLSFKPIDFDELVMDLEEHFEIQLLDDDLGVQTGKSGTGPGALTLGRLGAIIDAKLSKK
jgi:acyl carrier protein